MKGDNIMSFSDWLIIGGAALLIKNGMKKDAEAQEEHKRYIAGLKEQEAEWNRRRAVNMKRRDMPCFFNDGLSSQIFE